jgi:hypothetical protein
MASAASFLAAIENMATQEDRPTFCLATGERVAAQIFHFQAVVSHSRRYKGGSGEDLWSEKDVFICNSTR